MLGRYVRLRVKKEGDVEEVVEVGEGIEGGEEGDYVLLVVE